MIKNTTPVTHTDTELIFRLLDIITQEVHRLFDFGAVLDESADYEVEKITSRISAKTDEIRRLRQLLSRTRGIINHRKEIERQNRKNNAS